MFRSCQFIIRELCSLLKLYYSIHNSIRICNRSVVAAYHVVWECVCGAVARCASYDAHLATALIDNLLKQIYRMSQEEMSIFWEVIVSVFLSKNVHMNMCPILNGFQDRAIWMYNRKIVDKKEILCVRTLLHTSCKVRWCWRWNFRTLIINCTNCVTWTINTDIRNSTYT